jgi:2-phosphoglycerate kinase
LATVTKKPEPFFKEKIVRSITKAGASEELAKKIADEIEAKIGKKQTSTETIRRMVLARLRKEDKKAADAYTSYKKPKP